MTSTVLSFPKSPPPVPALSANVAVKRKRETLAALREFQELAVMQVACADRPVMGDRWRCFSNEICKLITAETAELDRLKSNARTARLEAIQKESEEQ